MMSCNAHNNLLLSCFLESFFWETSNQPELHLLNWIVKKKDSPLSDFHHDFHCTRSQATRCRHQGRPSQVQETPNAPAYKPKVEPGNAPVIKEGAGKVASESLAAESKREGGGFASNRGIRSENVSASEPEPPSGELKSTGSAENTKSYASATQQTSSGLSSSTAPTNANPDLDKHSRGLHGKNVKESNWDDSKTEDGLKKALESEPGSENDPSRLAEQKFQKDRSALGRDAGPRQADLATQTKYDTLNPEEST